MDMDHLAQAFKLVPDRRIASLYDVAVLYAGCGLYDKLTSNHVRSDLPLDVLRAMSPHEKANLLDPEEDASFIAAQVDLSGDEPMLGDPPVVIENYTEDIIYRVGHMYREKTGSVTAYSIVNGATTESPDKIAYDSWRNRFLRGRLERWPFCEAADTVMEAGRDENGVLAALRTLGSDDNVLETIEQALITDAMFDSTSALIGVKIKLDADGEYLYPGEIPVLNDVALQRRANHYLSVSVQDAAGEGVGFVSNEEATVYGASTGILGQYSKKHVGRFPDLIPQESWRSRPLLEDIAAEVFNFGSLVRNRLHRMVNGVRIYYLPYPRKPMTPELFKRFYNEVYKPLLSATDGIAALERILTGTRDSDRDAEPDERSALATVLAEINENEDESEASAYEVFEGEDAWLHVYGLFHVAGTNPQRTFVDEPSISLRALAALSDESDHVVETLGGSSLFGTMVAKMDRLSRGQTPRRVLQGQFFDRTTAKTPDEGEDRASDFATTADDALFARDAKLLRGKPIALRPLLDDYVNCITKQQRSKMNDSDRDSFPKWVVFEQYVQLLALERAEFLTPDIVLSHGLTNVSKMESDEDYDSRDTRLQDFLDSHAMLDTEEAQAVFLTGGLIARVTATQHQKNISTKMVDQHPVSSVTKRSLLRIAHQVIEKNETYEQMDERGQSNRYQGQLNRRYTDRLPGAMLTTNPTDWDLTETEVKWLYSLGIAYGKQDRSLTNDNTREESAKRETEATIN